MKKFFISAILAAAAFTGVAQDTDPVKAAPAGAKKEETQMEKVSYLIGRQIGDSMKRDGIEIDVDALASAMKEALAGKPSKIDQAQARTIMMAFQQEMMKKAQDRRSKSAAGNISAGKAFLDANKAKEGVKVTESGLQYRVLKAGTGDTPAKTDKVKVHYRGTLIDGTEFDSSYKRGMPATFGVTGVIKGWVEALQMMPVGSKWELVIPSELAYGARGGGSKIGPHSVLKFEVELLEIVK